MNEEERRIKAKLPGTDGIEIRHTMCDICTPGAQCGVDAYVKDGVVIKVEGTKGFIPSNGKLCAKGAANRQYIYRPDRLQTPLRRVGARGEGKFEPISWEDALDITADALKSARETYGPESVAWMCGYSKWFRPWLHRLTHSFGSLNFITESSTCHQAEVMSYKTLFGQLFMPDLQNAKMAMLWGSNGFMNSYLMARGVQALHESGGKIVVIDPRLTHVAGKVASLHLRPKIGTDGAIAHAMAKVMIEEDRIDRDFIEKYVHGFDEYADYVRTFDLARAESVSGVPARAIVQAIDLFLSADPSLIVPGNGLTHRINGYNNHRAILSLLALTGRVDRPGTILPEYETFCHSNGGFPGMEQAFIDETRPTACKPAIGHPRFPLWGDMVDEAQGMDLTRQIRTGEPYALHAAVCFGVNERMYPQSPAFLAAMGSLDFIVASDIFHTDFCDHADIVLPACSSFERSEAKCYAGRFVNWTRPAIEPLFESRDDVWMMTELARRLCPEDTLLCSGYDAGAAYILQNSGIEDWERVKDAPLPTPAPHAQPYRPGTYLQHMNTKSGKIELCSEAVKPYEAQGLNALPVYLSSDDAADEEAFPMTLMSGARIPNAIHSRVHDVPWLRSIRPDPSADIHPADAARLGIRDGEDIWLVSSIARIKVKAHVSGIANVGEVCMYHGYREANVNALIPNTHLDPYSGFPGYKQLRCRIEKA